jgi:hypothetical protein
MKKAPKSLESSRAWLRTVLLGLAGGAAAGGYTILIEPGFYHFPRDFGSGKLWEFFWGGFLLTVGGILVESPLGKRLMHPFEAGKETGDEDRKR